MIRDMIVVSKRVGKWTGEGKAKNLNKAVVLAYGAFWRNVCIWEGAFHGACPSGRSRPHSADLNQCTT